MRNEPIKLTIALGFAGVLALMGLISFISLSLMNNITEQMSALLTETNNKVLASNTMRDSIRMRGNTLHNMYLTDDYIERDEFRLKLAEHALLYRHARDSLFQYTLTAREAKLLDQITHHTRIAKATNDTAADKLLSDVPIEEMRNHLRLANQARDDMIIRLGDLITLQNNVTKTSIKETKKYQESISSIILYLSLAAFFIAVYIAQLVIRETSKKNSEIHYQATHDDLTKLVNRKEFNHRLGKAFGKTKESYENHALCFLDLDNFKTINDSCGHNAGDELLIQITRLIKNNIRGHDTLARLGGDEFGLLLEGCSLEKAMEITEGLVNLVKNYELNWHDKKLHVGVSIGLVVLNHETTNIEEAITQADAACYAAKDMGRNQVQIYGLDDDRIRKMQKELSWVADISETTSDDRFSLYLQAIEKAQDEESASMYEILLRLNDDQGALVSPRNYIPAAERFSLMKDVDLWVIEKTFKYLSHLYSSTPNCNVLFFINISANSLTNKEFPEYVIQQYKKYNIVPNTICFEIAEMQAIKNINQTANVISALKKYDIKFSLDDFGSAISSFSCLKNLPVDYLKIDGHLIKNISQNTADKAMVAAINQIGKVMNIKTIAKHVENVFTLNQLKEIGIDYAQGLYIDKPIHINERIKEIKESTKQQIKH